MKIEAKTRKYKEMLKPKTKEIQGNFEVKKREKQ